MLKENKLIQLSQFWTQPIALLSYVKHDVSKTEFCLRLQTQHIQLGLIASVSEDRGQPYLLGPTDLVPPEDEHKSSFRNVV
jgi:hypothetical protein